MTSKRHEFVFASGKRRALYLSGTTAKAARKTFGEKTYTQGSAVPLSDIRLSEDAIRIAEEGAGAPLVATPIEAQPP
jgi:hypothetical protein